MPACRPKITKFVLPKKQLNVLSGSEPCSGSRRTTSDFCRRSSYKNTEISSRLKYAAEDMPGYYQLNGALDQRDIVWPTLQVLKQKYLADMEELYVLMTGFDTQVLSADHARKFNLYKEIVRRLLTYLRVTRENLPLEFRENLLDSFAEQIVTIIEIFRKKPDRDDVAAAASFSGDRKQEGIP